MHIFGIISFLIGAFTTFIGVALIVVGIIFFLIKFIYKEPNKKNTVKCLKCGYIANQKEIFCSKCGNDLREQGTITQLQNIDKP